MLSKELDPTILVLKFFGFWTFRKCRKTFGKRWFYTLFILLLITVNSCLFAFNMSGIEYYRKIYGFVNVQTMSFVINGLKPLHAALNLAAFFRNRTLHGKVMKLFMSIDEKFQSQFEDYLVVRNAKFQSYGTISVCFVIPFGLRLSQYILQGEQPGDMWFSDLSLLLVPVLSLWQILPLYYFYLTNSILRRWFDRLNWHLSKETDFENRTLGDYIRTYQMLTNAVYLLGTFFNLFVFFSMGLSLSVMCITIYYVTAAGDIYRNAHTLEYVEMLNTYYSPAWTGLQISVAVAYLLVFCVCGWRTNEGARRISTYLLSLNFRTLEAKFQVTPHKINRDLKMRSTIFQIDQAMNKIYTQFNWGISIWRIVLFERSLLLTVMVRAKCKTDRLVRDALTFQG